MISLIIIHYLIKELEPICVLPWQPFLLNYCCHGNRLRAFDFFRDKNIKFQYYVLLSSKFQKHWEKFTLVNNSLVLHQLLVIHV